MKENHRFTKKDKINAFLLQFELFGLGAIMTIATIVLVVFTMSLGENPDEITVLLALGMYFCILFPLAFLAVKIEQVAGYYLCKKCGHTYIPAYKNVLLAPHIGRTRYMKCPECGQKSWQKKTLVKENKEGLKE